MKLTFLLIIFFLLMQGTPLFPQTGTDQVNEFLPDIEGVLKTKFEYDLDNLKMRFEVRNARFGAKGKINDYFSYKTELELSDEGKIKMLDAYVRFTPVSNLDIYMGQRKIPFSSDYLRSPAETFFANRSFVAKYLNEGLRDIGFFINYRFTGDIPVDIIAGAVNGTGNNNPQWVERPNFVGRVTAGGEKGLRAAGNIYLGESPNAYDLSMASGELRYNTGNLFIESEYLSRSWTDTSSVRKKEDGIYIHSYYIFNLDNKMINMIYPTARWDIMGSSVIKGDVHAHRVTFGINAGFEIRPFIAEIRFNYENYFRGNLPNHTDKLTIEFIGKF